MTTPERFAKGNTAPSEDVARLGEVDARLGLVAEYRSIREEQGVAQTQRTLLAAFVAAALGTIAGFAFRSEDADFQFVALLLALLVITGAAEVTRVLTQRIELLRAYLARYVEPTLGTTGYNRRLQQLQDQRAAAGFGALSQSDEVRTYAVGYSVLALLATSIYVVATANQPLSQKVAAALLTIVAVGGSADLAIRWLPSWRQNARAWQWLEEVLFAPAAAPRLPAAQGVWATVLPWTKKAWREIEQLLEQSAERGPPPEAGQPELPKLALGREVLARAQELCGLDDAAMSRVAGGEVELGSPETRQLVPQEREGALLVSRVTGQRVQGLVEIGEALVGGLGPEGVRAWLDRGDPPRFERLLNGDVAGVVAEARSYLSSVAG